jgi:hypothetical protein
VGLSDSDADHRPPRLCLTLPAFVNINSLPQIAGGWHGHKSSSAAVEAAAPAAVATESGAAAATGVDKKRHDWPIRLLTAYIVRPGEPVSMHRASTRGSML